MLWLVLWFVLCFSFAPPPRSELTLRSNPVAFGFAPPHIGNIVNTIQSGITGLTCPLYDPFLDRDVDQGEGGDVFVLALRGYNFGPPRADGKGPLVRICARERWLSHVGRMGMGA